MTVKKCNFFFERIKIFKKYVFKIKKYLLKLKKCTWALKRHNRLYLIYIFNSFNLKHSFIELYDVLIRRSDADAYIKWLRMSGQWKEKKIYQMKKKKNLIN